MNKDMAEYLIEELKKAPEVELHLKSGNMIKGRAFAREGVMTLIYNENDYYEIEENNKILIIHSSNIEWMSFAANDLSKVIENTFAILKK